MKRGWEKDFINSERHKRIFFETKERGREGEREEFFYFLSQKTFLFGN